MNEEEMSPQELADAVGKAMWARDRNAHAMGMALDAIGPGTASISMLVREDMLNGHDFCQGGIIFALADTAFAFACNSGNFNTLASSCDIDFLSPVSQGDRLQATAEVKIQKRRTGVYDVTVHNLTTGRDVAFFRGKSARIDGKVTDSLKTQ